MIVALPEERLLVFVDGACEPNPGPGGWSACLVDDLDMHIHYGGCFETTNNRMEMMAAIVGIEQALLFAPQRRIEVVTDSSYVAQGLCEWSKKWIKKGWLKRSDERIKNKDLWLKMILAANKFENRLYVTCVRGHTAIWGNELADEFSFRCINLKEDEMPKICSTSLKHGKDLDAIKLFKREKSFHYEAV